MAIPEIFSPVDHNGRLLVDGGVVNPLPHDLLSEPCSITVAIDVTETMQSRNLVLASFFDSIFQTFRIMSQSILEEKLKY